MFGGSLHHLTETAYAAAGRALAVLQRTHDPARLRRTTAMPSPASRPPAAPAHDNGEEDLGIAQPPKDLLQQVQADVNRAGGELVPDPDREGSIGATMFDLPGSEDTP